MTNKTSQRLLVGILLILGVFAGLYAFKMQGAKGGDPVTGKVVYDTHCASCHGPTGLGDGPMANAVTNKPTNLAKKLDSLFSSDRILIEKVVMPGRMNLGMPAFEGIISAEEAKDSFAYLRSVNAE